MLNTHTRYLSEGVVALAERLCQSTGDPERLSVVLFVNSGSEANDLAWRMAKVVTGNQGVICSEYAYHGITEACDAFTPANSAVRYPHARFAVPPNPYRYPQTNLMEVMDDPIKKLNEAGLGLAATIFDPTFMSDGILDKIPGYLKRCAEKTREAGGLYIADEVQSGFGRTGEAMWGYQSHGVVPDFITLGKPMGNGHPMGCVITTKAIVDRFIGGQDRRYFFSTFGGNNVSAAAGMAVLNVVRDQKLIENARVVGAYFKERLLQLKGKHSCIGDVRGQGLAIGVELVLDQHTRQPAPELTARVINVASRAVLMGREGPSLNVLKVRPPLVLTKENVDYAVKCIDEAIRAALQEDPAKTRSAL